MMRMNTLAILTLIVMCMCFSLTLFSLQSERSSLQAERLSLQSERTSLYNKLNSFTTQPSTATPASKLVVDVDTKEWFEANIKPIKVQPNAILNPYIQYNRKTVDRVSRWIEDDVYSAGYFQYGLPPHVKHLIDKPMGGNPTYSDALAYLGNEYLPRKKKYLEIGVSVGKSIYQMTNAFRDTTVFAYELENINPTLEKQFTDKVVLDEWDTMSSSIRKQHSFYTEYKYAETNSTLRYLTSDVMDENSWTRLGGEKFDIVFSDGLHSPEALRYELDMLIKLKLFNEKHFILWYDDLGGSMSTAFFSNFLRLKQQLFPHLTANNIALVEVSGWLGENEFKHMNGFISNLDVVQILKDLQ